MKPADLVAEPARQPLLDALAGILWADGVVDPGEVKALRAVAEALGLPSGAEALESRVMRGALGVNILERGFWGSRERAILYASAAWMTMADGVEAGAELSALDELRVTLGFSMHGAAQLADLALRLRDAGKAAPSRGEYEALLVGACRIADRHAGDSAPPPSIASSRPSASPGSGASE